MITSVSHSGQRTRKNDPAMSLLEFEATGPPPLAKVGFPAFRATVFQIRSFRGFIAARDFREFPVVPNPRVAFALAIDPLHPSLSTAPDLFHLVFLVGITVGTIRVKPSRHLHGSYHSVADGQLKPVWSLFK